MTPSVIHLLYLACTRARDHLLVLVALAMLMLVFARQLAGILT